jgi:hypothetical protein
VEAARYTRIDSEAVDDCGVGDAESVTVTAKLKVVEVVGTPEMTPPVERTNPGGKDPLAIAHE